MIKKYKITYYYDALCGWCYGFSPVMAKIFLEYREFVDFEIVSGGLFIGDDKGPIDMVAPHIKKGAYKRVEALTGVIFGDAFLKGQLAKGEMILDSLPPSIALCIVKEEFPEKTFEFAALLLKAFYFDGMAPESLFAYGDYAVEIGLDWDDFISKMVDVKYRDMALQDFDLYKTSQVNGFPTLVLTTGNDKTIVSRGFVNYDELIKRLSLFVEI